MIPILAGTFYGFRTGELLIYGSLLIAGLILVLLYVIEHKPTSNSQSIPNVPSKTPSASPPTPQVMEIFDYNGVKILHENGVYTVNQNGGIQIYKKWEHLPYEFQKMVVELDQRSLAKKAQPDYFLEILNGYYYVSMPGGKKKKYNTYQSIPEEIRKKMGKP